ncbi:hypothetical protein [Clostridium lundense]|uniref:hypothetical protein n=1 Tax=Clostridium lundense TaxID=319475 RepID=UPI0004853287|nr:hypothetical protein [Clostridium lundense]
MNKEYLLDANIVIKIWNEYPKLLDMMEKTHEIDYKIPQDIAGELAVKEFKNINGVPVLTDKFLKLLGHIINNDGSNFENDDEKNSYNNFDYNNYFFKTNKISINDYTLIHICEKHKKYTLVTEDKRILQSAENVLDPSRVLNFNGFIEELKEYNVIK